MKNLFFDKNQKFSKSSKIAFFDGRLRFRRYLAQPYVHVLKVSYAVVLSYDFEDFQNRQKLHFVPKIEPQAAEAGLAKRNQKYSNAQKLKKITFPDS